MFSTKIHRDCSFLSHAALFFNLQNSFHVLWIASLEEMESSSKAVQLPSKSVLEYYRFFFAVTLQGSSAFLIVPPSAGKTGHKLFIYSHATPFPLFLAFWKGTKGKAGKSNFVGFRFSLARVGIATPRSSSVFLFHAKLTNVQESIEIKKKIRTSLGKVKPGTRVWRYFLSKSFFFFSGHKHIRVCPHSKIRLLSNHLAP